MTLTQQYARDLLAPSMASSFKTVKELKELFSLKAFHISRRTEVEHCALEILVEQGSRSA